MESVRLPPQGPVPAATPPFVKPMSLSDQQGPPPTIVPTSIGHGAPAVPPIAYIANAPPSTRSTVIPKGPAPVTLAVPPSHPIRGAQPPLPTHATGGSTGSSPTLWRRTRSASIVSGRTVELSTTNSRVWKYAVPGPGCARRAENAVPSFSPSVPPNQPSTRFPFTRSRSLRQPSFT